MKNKADFEIKVGQELIVLYQFDWNKVPMPKGKGVITEVKATHFKTLHYDSITGQKVVLCWGMNKTCLGTSFLGGGKEPYTLQAFTERRLRYVKSRYALSLAKLEICRQVTKDVLMKLPDKDFNTIASILKKRKLISF